MNEEPALSPAKETTIPANEYERFLASLPDALRGMPQQTDRL